jgi:hypothetical protein
VGDDTFEIASHLFDRNPERLDAVLPHPPVPALIRLNGLFEVMG